MIDRAMQAVGLPGIALPPAMPDERYGQFGPILIGEKLLQIIFNFLGIRRV